MTTTMTNEEKQQLKALLERYPLEHVLAELSQVMLGLAGPELVSAQNERLLKLADQCLAAVIPDAPRTLASLLDHFTVNHVLTDLSGVMRNKGLELIQTDSRGAREMNQAASIIEMTAKRIKL